MWNPSIAVKARNGLCLSQRKFAEIIGVHPTTIAKWESGKKQPSKMAETLLQAVAANPKLFFSSRDGQGCGKLVVESGP